MVSFYETRVFKTHKKISAEEWNSINSVNDIFHTHAFLSDLEKANVENSERHYVMIYQNDKLICTAVLSAFIINLDIFTGAETLIKLIRKVWPSFLKVKVLMCGIPASLGQKNIIIKEGSNADEVIELINKLMTSISKKERIAYQAFKEFKEEQTVVFDSLSKKGFFRAFSLPYMKLDVKWADFPSYLSELRYGYKRQILASLKKIGYTSDFVIEKITEVSDLKKPILIQTDSSICKPELFYLSYIEVMKRATSKLETFNLDFFYHYFNSHKDKLVLLALTESNTVHGSAVLVPHGKELTFALIGKHFEKDNYDTYFNLITAIVKYGIENGYATINMGQTSYYPKAKVGSLPVETYLYFRAENFVMHNLLKMLKGVLFPKVKVERLNVFKKV